MARGVQVLLAVAFCYCLAHQCTRTFVGGGLAPERAGSKVIRHGIDPFAGGASAVVIEPIKTTETDRIAMQIIVPDGTSIRQPTSEVVLPSASGQLGVLAGHAPMMTALDIGVVRYKQEGTWKPIVIYGGFASVENNKMSVLVEDCEKAEDIVTDEAKKQLEEATTKLETASSKKEKLDATLEVKKASARLQAAMFDTKKSR